jgi:proteasome lid subunit RPN8/RPN11
MEKLAYWEIYLPSKLTDDMRDYAAGHKTEEVCGLMVGYFHDEHMSATALEFYPVQNIAKDPFALFVMDPVQQLNIYNDAFIRGKQIVGCFHSHPTSYGIPSTTDESMINEEYFWLIWGGKDNTIRYWYPKDVKNPLLGFQAAIRV